MVDIQGYPQRMGHHRDDGSVPFSLIQGSLYSKQTYACAFYARTIKMLNLI